MSHSNDIMSRMNAKYATMSKGQKVLSAYITDNVKEAAFMTAAKLGKAVGVSESTVVRFAIFLGYRGYPEFQKAIEDVVRGKLDDTDQTRRHYGQIKKTKVLESVLAGDAQRIRETLETIDEGAFRQAAELMCKAKTVYIIGTRNCAPLAQLLYSQLVGILDDVRVLGTAASNEIFEQLIRVGPEDVVLGISFPRYSMRTLKALEFANDKSAKVITLTDRSHSPLNLYSSCNLLAQTDMSSYIESMAAPLSVINALSVYISIKKQKEVVSMMEEMEDIWEEYYTGGNDEMEFVSDRVKFQYNYLGDLNE